VVALRELDQQVVLHNNVVLLLLLLLQSWRGGGHAFQAHAAVILCMRGSW